MWGCGRCYHNSKRSLVIVSILVLRLKASESFLETSQCTQRTQQRGSAEKSGLLDVKRANFIQYWQRSGLKNPDKSKIFIKKNIRNHSYHQFIRFWRRCGLTESGLTEVYCIWKAFRLAGEIGNIFPLWISLCVFKDKQESLSPKKLCTVCLVMKVQ